MAHGADASSTSTIYIFVGDCCRKYMVCWVLDCLCCALVSQRIEASTSYEAVPQIAVLWLPHIACVVEHASQIVMITISGSPVTCASPEARDATIHFLDFLSRLLVVSAANFMVFLSAKLLAPRQLVVNRRAQAVLLAIFCVCATRFAALHFGVPGCAANDFVVLIYAAACALAFMGVLSVVSQHRKSWQAIVFLLASIAGIVNATVPLHVPADVTWQPHFLARLLDVIFWLPGAIIALRWLDSLPA